MVNDAVKNREELEKKLMEYSSKDRINRHINVEIAFATDRQSLKQLQEVIRRLTKENAGLRHDVKKFEKLFSEAKESELENALKDEHRKRTAELLDSSLLKAIKDV